VLSLVTAMLGLGSLTMPNVLFHGGGIVGLGALATGAMMACASTRLLVRVLVVLEKSSYEEMAWECFGRRGAIMAEVCSIGLAFTTAAGYLLTAGDIMAVALHQKFEGDQPFEQDSTFKYGLWFVTLAIMMPVVMVSRISRTVLCWLPNACYVALLAHLALVFCLFDVYLRYGYDTSLGHPTFSWEAVMAPTSLPGFVRAVSFTTFAYACPTNIPAVYGELDRRGLRRMDAVTTAAYMVCSATYVLIGVMGYLIFGLDVTPSILHGLLVTHPLCPSVKFLLVTFFLCSITNYLINILPISYSLEMVLAYYRRLICGSCCAWSSLSWLMSWIICFATVFGSLYLAKSAGNLGDILQLAACVFGSILCFIFPGLFYVSVIGGGVLAGEKPLAWVMLFLGVFLLTYGTWVSCKDIWGSWSQ